MKLSSMRVSSAVLAAGAIYAACVGIAQAEVVITTTQNIAPEGTAEDPYDPATQGTPNLVAATDDLIAGMLPTVTYTGGTGSTNYELSAGESVWTDGSLATIYGVGGSANDENDHAAYGSVYGTVGASPIHTYVTYDLGMLYNIDQVDVFMGWNDSGRDNGSFNLNLSANGVNYTTITSYDKGGDDTGTYTTPVTNLHSITDSLGGDLIGSSVRYVQLQFTDCDNGVAGMVELDVFGALPTLDPADADRDGDVDIDDFYLISSNFLSVPSAIGLDGDIVPDNYVDSADFRLWKDRAPASALAEFYAQQVPEPSSVVLLALLGVCGFQMCVRRRV